jgi:hypothetical protein
LVQQEEEAMSRLSSVAIWCCLLAAPALAAPFVVPIDPAQSVLNFQLCISGSCSTDSSPVSGSVTLELANVPDPQQVWLYDFDFQLENLHWYISWGLLGSFTADASDAAIMYADPGTPIGPSPITSGAFSFTGVPVNSDGVLSYTATGLACSALTSIGMPCSDTTTLDQGTQIADQFGGTITSVSRVVTLASAIDVTSPLDPTHPDLGTIHVWGTVGGSVYVPPPAVGDTNCDGAVNAFDIDPFVLALTSPESYAAELPTCEISTADANGDGVINAFDIDPFVLLLTGG